MRETARILRKEPTKSERLLWEALRDRRLDGRKFRRQYPIGRFVLDFYCPAETLAVEVDGSAHDFTAEADAERQQLLESRGVRFVRLDASLVETDLPAALASITTALETLSRARERVSAQRRGEGSGVRDPSCLLPLLPIT